MRKRNLMNMVKTNKLVRRGGILVIATALAAGSWYGVSQIPQYEVPQLTSSIDEPVVVTGEDEVPLGNAKTTTKTTTKTTKKTVKLKKASTKTYKVTKPKTTKKNTKTSKNKKETVKVETTTVTSVVENYTKKSKNKVVTTSVKTTTKTTTTPVVKTVSSTTTKSAATSNSAKVETKAVETPQTYTIEELAPKADQSVLNAYSTLKFDVTVDPSVSYAGYFDARGQSITLQIKDDTIYHELGHFLAFMAGNVDTKDNFVAIYNEEKENFTGINKAYATQNSSEYFAESYKDYILDPTSLQSSRPQTYESITQALSTITDSHVNRVQTVYSSVWKK